jgi:uncharacterized protein YutD
VQSPSVTGQLEKKGQFKPNNETEDCVQKLDEAGEFIWRYKMWLCQHFRKWEIHGGDVKNARAAPLDHEYNPCRNTQYDQL